MKNVVLKFGDYKDYIVKTEKIYVKFSFFSGITFKDDDHTCFIYYDLITEEDRFLTIYFITYFEDIKEYNKYKLIFSNYAPRGASSSPLLPIIKAISCFYKSGNNRDQEESYLVYAEQFLITSKSSDVFTFSFNRRSYINIMYGFDRIRNMDTESLYNADRFIYLPPIDLIKLSNAYDYKICSKINVSEGSVFSSNRKCVVPFLFTNKKTHESYLLLLGTLFSLADIRKHRNKFESMYPKFLIDLLESIDEFKKSSGYTYKIPLYFIEDSFDLEYSISADTPMKMNLLHGRETITHTCKNFLLSESFFNELTDTITEYLA